MDLKKMTRAQAERIVARTDDDEVLRQLVGHTNSHVRSKVSFKLLSAEDRRAATAIKYLATLLKRISVEVLL